MKILVRLPNWLGDMVMSVGFIHQLQNIFPGAQVSVIAKEGIHQLLNFFPSVQHRFVFSKKEYNGLKGLYSFGKLIRSREKFDLFFCLPNSFSSAFMGYFTGAKERIGYKNEMRQICLTHSFEKPENIHRVEEYVKLLELYTRQQVTDTRVNLYHDFERKNHMVVNINSEASSRRLTVKKAAELIDALRSSTSENILLIGAPNEKDFVDSVFGRLTVKDNIQNVAGTTSLPELVELLASAKLMLTTDSGPAHLSNALGTKTIVLFGAGNEKHTAPFNKENATTTRLGELSCEPCEKNVCVRYGIPQCLQLLDTERIIQIARQQIYE